MKRRDRCDLSGARAHGMGLYRLWRAVPADAAAQGAGDRGALPGRGAAGATGACAAGRACLRRFLMGMAGSALVALGVPMRHGLSRADARGIACFGRRRSPRWLFLRWCRAARSPLRLVPDEGLRLFLAACAAPTRPSRRRAWPISPTASRRRLAGDVDEVLVVGHSSGAYIAVSVLADLIRAGRVPADGPALSLLTLGHVVPMVSFLPRRHAAARRSGVSVRAGRGLGRCDGAGRWLRLCAV